jgi:aryl-alcohol dehydrogenase-like predicted oxidoreductase/uncharacterized SAM-binding protein YcdF (DUF218 family)
VLIAVIALIAVFVLVTARLLIWPAEGMPARADAVVMMAGPGDRLAAATRLAREHRAPVLVVSQGQHGYGGPCPAPVPGVKLICFDPDPGNTRGEAEFASRLAKRYGWHSVVLVTTATQDTRARIVMRRCFGGSIYVITAPLPWYDLPYQIAYGWGALFKALFLHRACLRPATKWIIGSEVHNWPVRYLDVGTDKKISKIGLGTWQFGAAEWGYGKPYAEQEAYAIVRRALELGVTLFDTAEIYGCGRSERILGRALGENRESVFLATKIFPVVPGAPVIRQRAAASARRLEVSRLDLYQVHWPNPLVREATLMRGMRSLQRAGLVSEVGVSNYSLRQWRAAEKALGSRILSNQVGYSLVDRWPELELLPFAESHGHVVIAFSPLAQGLLSGRYHGGHGNAPPLNQVRAASPLFHPDSLQRTSDLIAVLREVADAHSATPAQIALAWAMHSPAVVAIPGAASVAQLESNVAAAEIALADDEYQALSTASARFRPDAVPDPSLRRSLSALEHSARGAWYVTKTIWADHRQAGAR